MEDFRRKFVDGVIYICQFSVPPPWPKTAQKCKKISKIGSKKNFSEKKIFFKCSTSSKTLFKWLFDAKQGVWGPLSYFLPTHFFGFFHFSGFWHFSCNYDQNKKKNFEDKKFNRGPQTPCLAPKSHLKSVFKLFEHLKKNFFWGEIVFFPNRF